MFLMRDKNYHSSIILPLLFILTLSYYSFISFSVFRTIAYADSSTQTMYRLYNPNSGEHFWTASTYERDNVLNAGWYNEGIGWYAPVKSNTPVYRLYNPNAPYGDHHYTMSKHEYDTLVKIGWRGEGIGWYSDDNNGTPVYRVYRPGTYTSGSSGAHHFTNSIKEAKYLINLGWNDEHIAWYGVKHDNTNTNTNNNTSNNNTSDNNVSEESLEYSYELRALSNRTYLVNQDDTPHAVFYLRTEQPDSNNIYYYDTKTQEYSHIEPISFENNEKDNNNMHFITKDQIHGYIINMPYGENISLYEDQNGKKVKINDVNVPDNMIEQKDYNASMTEWLENIKNEYDNILLNTPGLSQASSYYKFYEALYPVLNKVAENNHAGYCAEVTYSYRNSKNTSKTNGYYHADLLEAIENSSLVNDTSTSNYPDLWFINHQKCWNEHPKKEKLFETILNYVMPNEVEETLIVCDENPSYIMDYAKDGYRQQQLANHWIYVRFKDDSPYAPMYFIHSFSWTVASDNMDRDNHEVFSSETKFFEDYQQEVQNKLTDNTRIIWDTNDKN